MNQIQQIRHVVSLLGNGRCIVTLGSLILPVVGMRGASPVALVQIFVDTHDAAVLKETHCNVCDVA